MTVNFLSKSKNSSSCEVTILTSLIVLKKLGRLKNILSHGSNCTDFTKIWLLNIRSGIGNINSNVANAENRVASLEHLICNQPTASHAEQLQQAQIELQSLIYMEEEFYRQKAVLANFVDGDRNSRYFRLESKKKERAKSNHSNKK